MRGQLQQWLCQSIKTMLVTWRQGKSRRIMWYSQFLPYGREIEMLAALFFFTKALEGKLSDMLLILWGVISLPLRVLWTVLLSKTCNRIAHDGCYFICILNNHEGSVKFTLHQYTTAWESNGLQKAFKFSANGSWIEW